MRLDARAGDHGWNCFDVERCAVIPRVVWVDDQSATWGEFDLSPMGRTLASMAGRPIEIIHYEKCIKILVDMRMVLINPVDDSESEQADESVCHPKAQVEHSR